MSFHLDTNRHWTDTQRDRQRDGRTDGRTELVKQYRAMHALYADAR